MAQFQPSLFPCDAIADLGFLRERTASSPRMFYVPDTGHTYVVKSKSTNPAEPFTPANEFLAWVIAKELGLPIPDCALFEFGEETYFGSLVIQPKKLWCLPVLQNLITPGIIFEIVCFDIFSCNTDRHTNNFIFTENNNLTYDVHIIDHGRCFFGEAKDVGLFQEKHNWTDISKFVRIAPHLSSNHVEIESFRGGLDRIEHLAEEKISEVVRSVPACFLDDEGKDIGIRVLTERRARVRTLLETQMHIFEGRRP